MTDEEIVRARYPELDIVFEGATKQMGQLNPTESERWVVYPFRGLGAQEIGSGATEADAWADAATHIREQSEG